jgi:hypothetical protein
MSGRLKLRLMNRLRSRSKLGQMLLTPALVFWMAGVGCFFSCERSLARSVESPSDNVSATSQNSSCPSHQAHDCCVRKQPAARVHSLRTIGPAETVLTLEMDPSKSVESCPMAINANAIASKVRSSEVAVANNQAPLHVTQVQLHPLTQLRPTTLLDREATHLRCCVFLI